ncbi:hypothetical protein DFH28DRAFT_883865 [Melampsora americana]|nr:hypothetical protein DFH28DRAFT_883865 [Melampsora americana]
MHRIHNVVINEFMFCNLHGKELCFECLVDHRLGNNLMIEEELIKSIMASDWILSFLKDRKSIEVYKLGATPLIPNNPLNQNSDLLYQCLNHQTINCSICFAWVKIILNAL